MIRKPSGMKNEVRDAMRGGAGSVNIQHLFAKEEITAKTRLCARLTLHPGASIGLHKHENEDELFYILSGTGSLDDGKSRTTVAAGDAILTGKGEEHAIANIGETDLNILAVIMCYG
jgi:mannose-6-phosphate isomerase-like protein (cupin superfamily)